MDHLAASSELEISHASMVAAGRFLLTQEEEIDVRGIVATLRAEIRG